MPLLFLLATLAAAPLDGPRLSVTYALQRPLDERAETVLLERLPRWEAAYPLDAFALPVAPPAAGGELVAQVARLDRAAAIVGRDALVAVTPTVGTAGWEAGNNRGYLPLGGTWTAQPMPAEVWLAGLSRARVGAVALSLEGVLADPDAEQLGAQLDALFAATDAAGTAAELWLPAAWLAGDEPAAALAALTPERRARLRRLVWTDVGFAARALSRTEIAERETEQVDEDADDAPDVDDPVEAQARAEAALHEIVTRLAAFAVVGEARLPVAVDIVDNPVQTPVDVLAPQPYLELLAVAGIDGLVVRGRLDTPEAPEWRRFLRRLAADGNATAE